MNISYNWLTNFIDLSDTSPEQLAELLTMKTCEVEKVISFLPHLSQVIVGEIKKIEKHPDADKLVVCSVFNGKENVQVVTGAPNVKENTKYPFAPIGCILPGGLEMKKAKLRGLDSFGMLCSGGELNLEEFIFGEGFENNEKGVMALPEHFSVGQSLNEVLQINDTILEIDNKSITHRPDLWGHFGFAREIAALTGKKIKFNPLEIIHPTDEAVDKKFSPLTIKIENKSAMNYCGAIIDGVKVKPSPLKIQARLIATGMRPINNIVDFSNYVMLEIGQPNHAFDRRQIKDVINISPSKAGETLKTLDNKEHTLPDGIILIRDGQKPVALAGVMGGGGESTEVSEDSETLFFESATFYRHDIRKAVSSLNIRSEASQRFEKGQDPSNSLAAVHRFANLLTKSGLEISLGSIQQESSEAVRHNKLSVSIENIIKRLGPLKIDKKQVLSILTSLGLQCSEAENGLTNIVVPSYRSYFDISIEEDLVEEIGRVVGYAEVTPTPLMVACEVPKYKNKSRDLEHQMRKFLADQSFTEVYTYAFHSEKQILLDKRCAHPVKLQNPINADLPFMRVSPLPGLLKVISEYRKSNPQYCIFEIERFFLRNHNNLTDPSEKFLPAERNFAAGLFTSNSLTAIDSLRFVSALCSALLESVGVAQNRQLLVQEDSSKNKIYHLGRRAKIEVRNEKGELITACRFGQISPQISDDESLSNTFYFEFILNDVLPLISDHGYHVVFKYPASDFQVTVVVDERITFREISQVAGKVKDAKTVKHNDTFLESIEHVDTYKGANLEENKKAVSLKLSWINQSRTLEHDEIKLLQQAFIKRLEKAGFPLKS